MILKVLLYHRNGLQCVSLSNLSIILPMAKMCIRDRYLYDADFLRIRNVSLGYTLPKKFCKIIGIENMRISANVQNLWTFDKYPGYSVEANYEGNSATNNGVDFGGYPISRTFTFGLNFNF